MIGRIIRVLAAVSAACLFLLALLLIGCRLFGLTPYNILSGSMLPAYPVGLVIYVAAAGPEEVAVGDAITFFTEGAVATHRVIAIDAAAEQFTTKGDANDTPDAPIPFSSLIGKPVFCIPYLGGLSAFLARTPGKIAMFSLVFAILLMLFISYLLESMEADKEKASDEGTEVG